MCLVRSLCNIIFIRYGSKNTVFFRASTSRKLPYPVFLTRDTAMTETIFITGSNRGIGLELVQQLADHLQDCTIDLW